MQRGPVQDRAQQIAHRAHDRRIEHAGAVLGGDLADAGGAQGVVQRIAVVVDHALGRAGRAGGVEDIGQGLGSDGGATEALGGGRTGFQLHQRGVRIEQRTALVGEVAGDHRRYGAGVPGDAGVAFGGMVGIQQDHRTAGGQGAEESDDETGVERQQQGDGPERLGQDGGQTRGDAIALGQQLAIGHPPVQVGHGQTIWVTPSHVLEAITDGLPEARGRKGPGIRRLE